MNALAILAHLKAAGVRVSRRGDNLDDVPLTVEGLSRWWK